MTRLLRLPTIQLALAGMALCGWSWFVDNPYLSVAMSFTGASMSVTGALWARRRYRDLKYPPTFEAEFYLKTGDTLPARGFRTDENENGLRVYIVCDQDGEPLPLDPTLISGHSFYGVPGRSTVAVHLSKPLPPGTVIAATALDEHGRQVEFEASQSFTCPDCGMTSHNPNDVAEGYCGNCHKWTGRTHG